MKKIFNIKNLYIKVLVIIFCIYFVSVLINQQTKLKSYKQSLKALKENIDSPEYIEEIAREKLGMYLPNERVYIDVGTK